MELWQRADEFTETVFISPLAVSKAAFKPHQQFGDPGATEPRAFLQDVSSLYPCCKTFFSILSKFLILYSFPLKTCFTCIEFRHLQCFCYHFVSVDEMRK